MKHVHPGLVVIAAALLVTACSAGSDAGSQPSADGEPTAAPEVGTYTFATEIMESNIDGERDRVGATATAPVVLSCADDACETLHLRAGATSGPMSRTFRLTRSADGISGRGVRVGPCTESGNPDEPGDYTETITFDLTADGDDLAGTHDYLFTGCGFDAKATVKDSGTRTSNQTPYLTQEQVTTFVPALTSYDAAVSAVYAQANACIEKPDDSAATCYLKVVEPWAPTFDDLEAALDGLGSATGPCKEALGELDLPALHATLDGVVKGLGNSKTRAATYADKAPKLATQAGEEHENLVTALALCTDPRVVDSFGEDGKVAFDINGRLPVMPTG